jgi:hypothetical protein
LLRSELSLCHALSPEIPTQAGRGAQVKKFDGKWYRLVLQLLVSVVGCNALLIVVNKDEDLVVYSEEGGAIVATGNVLPGMTHTVR